MKLDVDRVAVRMDATYPMAGLLIAGGGLFSRGDLSGSGTKYPTLHRLHANQLVYRKLTAWEGPITIVPAQFDGYFVSSEFPTFTLDNSQLLPEYMRLVCQRQGFHTEMRVRSRGTAERRKRLNPDDLLTVPISLPSLDRQRRVVEAAKAIDRAIDALRVEARALHALRASLREWLVTDGSWELTPLADLLLGIDAGKSPKCEERPPADGEWGVLKVSSIRPMQFRPEEAKVVPDPRVFGERAKVTMGDVLANRASGSVHLVASICIVEQDPPNVFLSDKTLRLRFVEGVEPSYVAEAVATVPVRDYIRLVAKGSSGQKNVSQDDIRELEIPLPPLPTQVSIARRMRVVRAAEASIQLKVEATQRLRTALLEELLAAEAPTPEAPAVEQRVVA